MRLACRPCVAVVKNLLFPEPDPAEQPLCIPLMLPQPPQRQHALPVEQAEISHIHQHGNIRKPRQYAIIKRRRRALKPRLPRAAPAPRVHILPALLPCSEHRRDQRRRILQICIHHDDRLPLSIIKPREHRGLLAEIAREREILHPRILRRQPLQDRQRPVPAAVIDKKKPERILRQIRHHRPHRLIECPQHRLLVITRHQNRHLTQAKHLPQPPCKRAAYCS